ncbi:GNAT family N-acetyltransferase [Nonomuraea sp. NPDC049684]|uniref:GNAT family N-acetyltransferase n=1 Tax=unclassified Nonomuraea TaxID=2593643 RepID=UPI0037BE1898
MNTPNDSMDVIETPRLSLVPLRVEHAAEMAAVLADPRLHEFTGGAPATGEELRARYERLVAGPIGWRNWVLRLRADGRLTGYVQATVEAGTAEIAWVVGVPWQGRGLAAEAARALVSWCDARDVGTVVAHIHPGHAASAAVAAHAGLHPTDLVHDGEIRWERVRP